MHPEIKSVINVSFSGDNFIENVVYIKTYFFHVQHPLRKHISTCVAHHQCPCVHVSGLPKTLNLKLYSLLVLPHLVFDKVQHLQNCQQKP